MGKIVGILGGMGPLATVKFMEKIIDRTPAVRDQEHLEMVSYLMPTIPDRSDYLLGRSEDSPLPHLVKYVTALEKQTDFIAIPCMTVMHFYPQIKDLAPVICFPQVVLDDVRAKGYQTIGVLATEGTVATRVLDAYAGEGMTICYPDAVHQQLMMEIIYDIKRSGDYDAHQFEQVVVHLKSQGVEVLLLACTELAVIQEKEGLSSEFYIDILEILTNEVVRLAKV